MTISWPQLDLLWAAVIVLAVIVVAISLKALWTWIQRKGRQGPEAPED